jgi:hypothetical protein
MKTTQITTLDFFNYLESLDLFRWSISNTPNGMEAILSQDSKPCRDNFTQVLRNGDGTWFVRLSNADYHNDLITKGFFN